MKYIALLRGINVGGKNKVSMGDLKDCFREAGAKDAETYINSGNVVFSYDENSFGAFAARGEEMLKAKFGFPIGLYITDGGALKEALEKVPGWWASDPACKHNTIFVMPPMTAERVAAEIGSAPEYENVYAFGQIIFWSASLEYLGRTKWSRAFESKSYKNITIRNANTTKKLLELAMK